MINFFINKIRYSKIQVRLIVSYLLISVIPLAITGFMSYFKASTAIEDKIKTYSSVIMRELSNNANIQVEKIDSLSKQISFERATQDYLINYAQASQSQRVALKNDVVEFFVNRLSQITDVVAAQIFTSDNVREAVATYGQEMNKPLMRDQMAAFKESNKDYIWTTTQLSSKKAVPAVLKTIVSTEDQSIIGYVLLAAKPDYFDSILANAKNIGGGADVFMLSKEGTVTASTNSKDTIDQLYRDKSLILSLQKELKNKKGAFITDVNKISSLVSFVPIQDGNWFMVNTLPMTSVISESVAIRNNILIISITCIFAALLFSYVIAQSVSKPSKKLVSLMKEAANGDLTVTSKDIGKDELFEINSHFTHMVSQIRSTIDKAKQSAMEVGNSAESINKFASTTFSISEQTTAAVQEIAKGSASQAEDIVQNVMQINQLSENINEVEKDMTAMCQITSDTSRISEDTHATIKDLNEKARITTQVSTGIISNIKVLNENMKEINKIVNSISGISDKTNLLALNAAIEAARSGSAGLGFAVIAEEVRDLAEQTKKDSNSIREIIAGIVGKMEEIFKQANQANQALEHQTSAVKGTDDAFNTILNSLQKITYHTQSMQHQVVSIVKNKENSIRMIENISAVAEESASTSEEVAAMTQEQINYSKEVFMLAGHIRSLSNGLNSAISQFRI